MTLTVREMTLSDIDAIVDYFVDADDDFLKEMGATRARLPKKEDWKAKLIRELKKPAAEKEYYYLIWLVDDVPVGHSNINSIVFGQSANMHLHMWSSHNRARGLGLAFVKLSIPYYFKNFSLQKLICEPYAENPAPNRILEKAGFSFIRDYETIPGMICFQQKVNLYALYRDTADTELY